MVVYSSHLVHCSHSVETKRRVETYETGNVSVEAKISKHCPGKRYCCARYNTLHAHTFVPKFDGLLQCERQWYRVEAL